MTTTQSVAIIGAGVSGLTCSVVLRERGYDVTLFESDAHPAASPIAAAIWYPYHIEPRKNVERWSLESYDDFVALTFERTAGVSLVDFHVMTNRAKRRLPSWSRGMQRRYLTREEAAPYRFGFAIQVPMIETPLYLPYLRKRLGRKRIRTRTIHSIDELTSSFDAVVNCSGYGAKTLCNDRLVKPGRGIVLKANACDTRAMVCDEGDLTYILPRRDDCVLGGTDDDTDDTAIPTKIAKQIHARCRAVEPSLSRDYVAIAGIRPLRKAVRLEREPGTNIIHNYGHGGAGFTVSWGCAREVLREVEQAGR
ncbi:MAG TPA: FAD-dependent oxidoreductase [Thermoanaerobaculia bacterium]|nr:FAD-dependent oxidoreductase [Thermoanaerobaculia bacterium]